MKRRDFLHAIGMAMAGASVARSALGRPSDKQRPNVLFICVDDLRPQLGCYGHDYMKTPRLDAFAQSGRLFERHFVQVPTCGASRCSLLTGARPNGSKRLGNGAFSTLSKKATPEPQTMPEFFRRQGYHTASIGKISHNPDGHLYAYDGSGSGEIEVPFAWDEAGLPYGKWKYGWGSFFGYANGLGRTKWPKATATEAADVEDEGYPDGLIAKGAVEKLESLKGSDSPFFLAVGFFKPHLPFNAPKRYWDLYDRDNIPLSPNPKAPKGINKKSLHSSGECFNAKYNNPQKLKNTEASARQLRHGYFAAVSYIDAQVGKVLDALDRLKMADDTIVVVWGDHGWHLGDHGLWGKHSSFERALRSALIIRAPGMASPGKATAALVESVDLYPTLADLCGLRPTTSLDGDSIAPLLADPNAPSKRAAYGYWGGRVTMRTDRYRLTAYGKGEPRVELFDHKTDPYEERNVAAEQPKIVAALLPALREHAAETVGLKIE